MPWSIKGISAVLLASSVLMPLLVAPPQPSASSGTLGPGWRAPAQDDAASILVPVAHWQTRVVASDCALPLPSLALLAH